jgi:hypothetical protein
MWHNDTQETHLNWVAVFSLAGSAVFSFAVWVGLIRFVEEIVQ